jgi:predicted MFS family arabinose efflux permease
MPDTVPPEYRSEANGVINMMGGLGLIISTLVLARLMNVRVLPEAVAPETLPFGIAGVCILAAVLVLLAFVREKLPEPGDGETKTPLIASIKQVFSGEQKASVGRILIALFCWFLAYEGIKPFLGLYLVEHVGVDEGSAALAQGVAGLSSVILAVPSGALAHKLGRRRFIRICLLVLTVILLLIPITGLATGTLSLGARLAVFLGLMFLYGVFWIGVVVNSFPMLWQMADYHTMGIYTSLYYTFSQAAAILAPPLVGGVIDLTGYPGLFVFGAAAMLAACFAMGGVKAGETAEGA